MPFTENLPQDERSGPREGRVLIVCNDLFFGTQIAGLVREAGFDPSPETMAARAFGQLQDPSVIGVVLDLETPGVDPAAWVTALPPESRPTVVAFGPHVHKVKLDAARDAGCDAVFTRGQSASSSTVLKQALSEPRPERQEPPGNGA
jgi:hypothetical protein